MKTVQNFIPTNRDHVINASIETQFKQTWSNKAYLVYSLPCLSRVKNYWHFVRAQELKSSNNWIQTKSTSNVMYIREQFSFEVTIAIFMILENVHENDFWGEKLLWVDP